MICRDVSIACKWIVPEDEEHVDLAGAPLDDHLAIDEELTAPLRPGEVANTVHRRLLRHGLPRWWADRARESPLGLPVTIDAHGAIYHDALRIAAHFGLPAIHGAHDDALAQSPGCALLTDDHRFVQAVQHELPIVRALSEYGPRR